VPIVKPRLPLAVLALAKSDKLFAFKAELDACPAAVDAELAAAVAEFEALVACVLAVDADVLALDAEVEASLAFVDAVEADVLASPALVLAVDALAADAVAELAASLAFCVTVETVTSLFASPAPPSPRNIAILYSLFDVNKRKEQPPKGLLNLYLNST
jgi:hypothetical protein